MQCPGISLPDMLIRIELTDVSIDKKSPFATYPNRNINWPDMLIRIKLTDVSIGKKSLFATYPNRNKRSNINWLDMLSQIKLTDCQLTRCPHFPHILIVTAEVAICWDTLLRTSHVAILWLHFICR